MVKKIILPGLAAGVIMLVAGVLVSFAISAAFPALKSEYENPGLFRPWADPLMSLYFLHPFVLGIVLAWIWDKTKIIFSYEVKWKNALYFALAYWLVTLPGMLISYSTFPVSVTMIFSWTLSVLVQAVCAGFLLSKMNTY